MAKTRTEPTPPTVATRLAEHLRELRLPAFRDHYQNQAERAAKEQWGYRDIATPAGESQFRRLKRYA